MNLRNYCRKEGIITDAPVVNNEPDDTSFSSLVFADESQHFVRNAIIHPACISRSTTDGLEGIKPSYH